ncbi:MAG: hypothetical protein KatS3mg092_0468 [Patescibacteria group bacterium]|nr:MAG: hypothetical protein KatS3mg092_0468 [Patescibacteria group bacterium]
MTEKWYNLYNLEPQFKNFLIAENFSPISLKNYLSDFRYFVGWLNNNIKYQIHYLKDKIKNKDLQNLSIFLTLIDLDFLNLYKKYLLENNTPLKTINRRLSTIRKFFSFCISQGWLKENPAKKVSNISHLQTKNYEPRTNNKASESHNIISNIKPRPSRRAVSNIFSKFKNLFAYKSKQNNNTFVSIQYYIGLIIILIFVATLGAGIYNQFFNKSEKTFAYPLAPTTRAGRILSFQGRLTDTLGNPITTATNVTFRLYNTPTGGTALYTAGACAITPNQDGIFNVLIGGSGYTPTPPQEVCGTEIPASIFTENANIYMGITVASDAEMTPRQQIANVGYAINAETLQGLPPGINTSTIPYINQDGNLLIAASTPGIRSTFSSADFTLSSAKATIIQSAGTGDIILQATESGTLKVRTGGNSDVYNRLIIDNNGLVGIGLTPSQNLEVAGNIYANSGQIRLGNFASAPTSIGSGSVYYNSTNNKIYYYNGSNWEELSSGFNWWKENLGLLYPVNSTLDLAIGGTATSSAKFAFTNINSGTPTFKMNQASSIDLPNSTVNALNIESDLMSFDTQNNRVGIGTTTPLTKLDIYQPGLTGWAGRIISRNQNIASMIGVYNNVAVVGAHNANLTEWRPIYINTDDSLTSFGNVIIGGNVGIGTTSPAAKLDVSGSIFASQKVKADYFTDYNNENYGLDPASITNFGGYSLKITGGALLAVDTGNVGIGTTPSHKLSIAGGYQTTGLSGEANQLHIGASGTSPNAAQIVWGDNTGWKLNFGTRVSGTFTERVTILDTGNVGIGTTGPNYKIRC